MRVLARAFAGVLLGRRVHDFRLDPKLRESCEEDIFNMCAYYNVREWQGWG